MDVMLSVQIKLVGKVTAKRPIVTEKVSNGGFLIKTTDDVELSKQDLEYCNDESAKCATIDASVLTEAKQAYTEKKRNHRIVPLPVNKIKDKVSEEPVEQKHLETI
ncbi:hypothetical protein HPP92_005640 [Vanilla planifolia]|uniref:Uncharacterized protein n=1 Tax=Vanilla planifolia TaxID=51239 RepID=A0A835RM29_VANPL|nr:hypothetical protein HPP92_005640 [Vanilla planifolia]